MAFIENTDTEDAAHILYDLHFQVFNDVQAVGDCKKRKFQTGLRGLRTLEHAVAYLNGDVFSRRLTDGRFLKS